MSNEHETDDLPEERSRGNADPSEAEERHARLDRSRPRSNEPAPAGEVVDEFLERIRAFEESPARKAERAEEEARIARMTEQRRHQVFEETGVPLRIREIVTKPALDVTEAREALADIGHGIVVLSGVPGSGKTVAAAAWIRDVIWAPDRVTAYQGYQGRPPLFVTSHRLARWDRYDNDEMRKLLRADRLVIDDLGGEYADQKGNFAALIDEIVLERHGQRRPLVMTTNLDAALFKERYEERVADRIRESGRFVSLAAGSMRKRASS